MIKSCCLFVFLFLLTNCDNLKKKNEVATGRYTFSVLQPTGEEMAFPLFSADTKTERKMREAGLVDIQEIDPSIQVYLVYATSDNFVGQVLYPDVHKAFMLPEVAMKLTQVQQRLKTIRPDLSLLIYDAARPLSVQQKMWDQVKGTDKHMYVSNPKNGGGLHNYGAAVDVTLVDSSGTPLPMGSPFDYFGDEARPDKEELLIQQKKIMEIELANRLFLRQLMKEAGFRILPGEWWHFNLVSRAEARATLTLIE